MLVICIGRLVRARILGGVLLSNGNTAKLHALPSYPTLKGYVELLLDSLGFFVMFWNSCKQVFPILIGQVLIGVPAAWAFAHFVFPGKKYYFIYICYL